MLQKIFYQEKGLFLQSLHPAASITFVAVLLVLAVICEHPLYLAGILLVSLLALWAADGLAAWQGYMKAAFWMVVLVMAINPLINHNGNTVLWQGPCLPLYGRPVITMEAIAYGAAMSVRLLDMVSVFCLFNLIVHPDRFFGLFSIFARKSALVVALATRLFPVMFAALENIRDAQQLRGVDFSGGTLRERAVKGASLFNILLVSALEDSLQLAEAMHARAFGSGPRSRYRRDILRPRDGICLAGNILSLAASIYILARGLGNYTYFPELSRLCGGSFSLPALAAVLGGLSLPALLSWGCNHCHYLKLKI
ncbi:MAG: Energy-coupling factor transporter transmembrane protein EcfT [Pelotomaculum sp. PtaB.Bin104]|nr:MAG: Energy-coupling factor transporter transmembrane protein EcfT [Pelotomaculum sp. PtaB.Bin104]